MKNLFLGDTSNLTKLIEQIYDPSYSTQFIPAVHNYVSQGEFYFKTPGLSIRKVLQPAIITGFSDVIQVGQYCIYEKLDRITADKIKVFDVDVAGFDRTRRLVSVRNLPLLGGLNKAYSMLGALSFHWGHFIYEFLPSFVAAIAYLDDDVVLVLPNELDSVQRSLISAAMELSRKTNKVVFVPKGHSVLVDELFLVERSAFVSDHADWMSIYDIVVQDFSHKEMIRLRDSFRPTSSKAAIPRPKKIFLTRVSQIRPTVGLSDAEYFFRSSGYSVVDPGSLSHDERIDFFSECEVLTGILGSSYANLVYCPRVRSVKSFAPFCRCFDGISLAIFRPDSFTNFLVESSGEGIHPHMILTRKDCELMVG